MKNHDATIILIKIYSLLTIGSIAVWIFAPQWSHFFGANSILELFLFSISLENPLVLFFYLVWLLIFIVSFVISYILAINKNATPFVSLVAVDLLISIVLLIYKICISNYTDLLFMFTGWFVRVLFYVRMVIVIRKSCRR